MDQAVRVDEHDGALRGIGGQAGVADRFGQEAGDPDAGRAGAHEEHPDVSNRRALCAEGGKDAGHNDDRGALDVVVEGRHTVAVLLEDAQRVVVLEVLPLDDAAGPHLLDAVDERRHQGVVLVAAQPRRAMPDVERVIEQRWLFVPTSSETGRVSEGWRPHAAVYRASFPTGMPMPPAPWSPRPRIRSLSVTTISRTSAY